MTLKHEQRHSKKSPIICIVRPAVPVKIRQLSLISKVIQFRRQKNPRTTKKKKKKKKKIKLSSSPSASHV